MKILISTLFLLMMTTISYAKSNLLRYYQQVNEAELSITTADFKSALKHYQNAFSNKEEPFAMDYYNAVLSAIKSDDRDLSYMYCNRLAKKGVGAAFFEKKSVFQSLKSDANKWNALIQKANRSADALNKKNSLLYGKLKRLYERDQEMHKIWAHSDYNSELESKMKEVDDSISNELLNIFDREGFLSEPRLGVFMENDTMIAYEPGFYIIMLHNFQGQIKSDTLFAPILRQAVQDGSLRPVILAGMFDGNYHPSLGRYGTNMYITYRCVLYLFNLFTKSQLEEIDANRQRIYLPSLEDSKAKLLFNINNPQNDFMIFVRCHRIGSFGNESSENDFLKNTKAIQKLDNCD